MNLLFSLLAGLVFGLGLIVAGMANPAKVLSFWILVACGTHHWRW